MNTQDTTTNDEQQQRLLELAEANHTILLRTWPQRVLRSAQKVKSLYITLLLICIATVMIIAYVHHHAPEKKDATINQDRMKSRDWDQHYAEDGEDLNENSPDEFVLVDNNSNIDANSKRPFQLRSYSGHSSNYFANIGHMNIYIRPPTQNGGRRPFRRFRFPAALYSRRRFPLVGPFVSYMPMIPIFVDRRTRQTLIYSTTGGIYILPPLVNMYGNLFSIAELLASGYASLVSTGNRPTTSIDMASFFQPIPLAGANVPMINLRTGIFRSGMNVNYGSFNIPDYREALVDKIDSPFQPQIQDKYRSPSYSNDNYDESRQQPRPPRRRPRPPPYDSSATTKMKPLPSGLRKEEIPEKRIINIPVEVPTSGDAYVIHETRGNLPPNWVKRDKCSRNAILPLRIALSQPNLDMADKLLMDVSDPNSPNFGIYKTSEEIRDLFAPQQEAVSAVIQWLQDNGINTNDVVTSASKGWLSVNVPVAQAEKLLQADYNVYEHSTGKSHPATMTYSVPAKIRSHIDFITPTLHFDVKVFGNRPKSKNWTTSSPGEGESLSVVPFDFVKLGGPAPLANSGVVGNISTCNKQTTLICLQTLYNMANYTQKSSKKNTYGIVEYTPQSYVQSDLDLFLRQYYPSANGTKPVIYFIDGGVLDTTHTGDFSINAESNLDLQVAIGLVYPTPVTLYQTGDPVIGASFNNFLDAIDASYCTYLGGDNPTYDSIYPDNQKTPGAYNKTKNCGTYPAAYVISTSYAYNEADLTPAYEQRQCYEYSKLGLQGITVLYSSGDYGVAGNGGDCINPRTGKYTTGTAGTKFNPSFPGTCPYVTAVGATQINPTSTVYNPESACEQVIYSGGGFSNVFSTPSYQTTTMNNYFTLNKPTYTSTQYNNSGKARGYPDISANGANYAIAIGGTFSLIYGTSASSPVIGAIITLINDARLAVNKTRVGFVNPVLYANPTALNDITSGKNPGCHTNGFSAVKGWDPVTGLGTPNFQKLLAVYLSLP